MKQTSSSGGTVQFFWAMNVRGAGARHLHSVRAMMARPQIVITVQVQLRATGSRERAPDDRLREAIHAATKKMDCFAALAMTVETSDSNFKQPDDMPSHSRGVDRPRFAS